MHPLLIQKELIRLDAITHLAAAASRTHAALALAGRSGLARITYGNVELMAKKTILRFKPAARLEQVGDEHSERVKDCKHRPQSCDDSNL
jgi:hypothetical protein